MPWLYSLHTATLLYLSFSPPSFLLLSLLLSILVMPLYSQTCVAHFVPGVFSNRQACTSSSHLLLLYEHLLWFMPGTYAREPWFTRDKPSVLSTAARTALTKGKEPQAKTRGGKGAGVRVVVVPLYPLSASTTTGFPAGLVKHACCTKDARRGGFLYYLLLHFSSCSNSPAHALCCCARRLSASFHLSTFIYRYLGSLYYMFGSSGSCVRQRLFLRACLAFCRWHCFALAYGWLVCVWRVPRCG